jgi:hypothetical protein
LGKAEWCWEERVRRRKGGGKGAEGSGSRWEGGKRRWQRGSEKEAKRFSGWERREERRGRKGGGGWRRDERGGRREVGGGTCLTSQHWYGALSAIDSIPSGVTADTIFMDLTDDDLKLVQSLCKSQLAGMQEEGGGARGGRREAGGGRWEAGGGRREARGGRREAGGGRREAGDVEPGDGRRKEEGGRRRPEAVDGNQ